MPISQSSRDRQRATAKKEIENLGAEAQNVLDDFFDGPAHPQIKRSVLGQLVALLTQVDVTGTVAPAQLLGTTAVHQLVSGSSNTGLAALGTGSSASDPDAITLTGDAAAKFRSIFTGSGSTPEQVVDRFYDILGSFQGETTNQIDARTRVIEEVAKGRIVVDDDGNLQVQNELDAKSEELSTAQRDLTAWDNAFGATNRALLNAHVSPLQRTQRLAIIEKIARGEIALAADGTLVIPTQGDTADHDALVDIKATAKDARFREDHIVIDLGSLKPATRTLFEALQTP